MATRPSSDQAQEALRSLLAAAFASGHDLTADSVSQSNGFLAKDHATSSSSTDGDTLQPSGDGTPLEPQGQFMQALKSFARGTDNNMLHSHTMALLAAQPSLLPGLTFAPPSPGPRTRSTPAIPQPLHSQHTSYYTPLPTRSGRVPQVPGGAQTGPETAEGLIAEPARETMLFNDYFDWPSSDDEDDPDFQPQAGGAGWGDIVIGKGGGVFSQDEEEEDDDYGTDFSAVDEGFTPGDMTGVQDGFSLAGLGSDDIMVGGVASTSRLPSASVQLTSKPPPSTRTSRTVHLPSTTLHVDSSSPAANSSFVPPLPPRSRTTSASATKGKSNAKARTKSTTSVTSRRRARTALSPLPEDPVEPAVAQTTGDLPTHAPSPASQTLPATTSFAPPSAPATTAPAPALEVAPPDDPQKAVRKYTKKRPNTSGGKDLPLPDGTVKRVRGVSEKLITLTPEQKEAHKRERQRLQAKAARAKKKQLMQGFEEKCEVLEEENKALKARVKQLERQLGVQPSPSDSGQSRERSETVESLEEEDDDEEDEEDEEEQPQTQPPQPVPLSGLALPAGFDMTKLTPEAAKTFIESLALISQGFIGKAGGAQPM